MERIKVIALLKVTLSGHLILLSNENVLLCRGGKTSYFNSKIVLYNIKN
jgi:hypothetical protein